MGSIFRLASCNNGKWSESNDQVIVKQSNDLSTNSTGIKSTSNNVDAKRVNEFNYILGIKFIVALVDTLEGLLDDTSL